MAFTNLTVTGKYVAADGVTPLTGTVTFAINYPMTNGGTTHSAPVVFTLDASGQIPGGSVVKAVNDSGTLPTSGLFYTVTEAVGGKTRSYVVNARVQNATIDLGTVKSSDFFDKPATADSVAAKLAAPSAVTSKTANYTLALGDAGSVVEMNSGSATTLTVPANATVPFPVGTEIRVSRMGAGTVTFAGAGSAVLRNPGSALTVKAQYGTVILRKRATDEWILSGDVTP